MMDTNRLAEIKARAEAARDNYRAVRKNDELYETLDHDIPDLIAEVERLAKCRHECKIEYLLGEYEKLHAENTRLRAELEAAQATALAMAQHIISGVPFECEVCTNHMRNMAWDAKVKGCDGNCQHENGIPDTPQKVIEYFSGGRTARAEEAPEENSETAERGAPFDEPM